MNKKELLLFIVLIFSSQLRADPCSNAYNIYNGDFKYYSEYFKSKLKTPVNNDLLRDDELIIAMVNKNPQLLFHQNELAVLRKNHQLNSLRVLRVDELNRVYIHPNYATYDGVVTYRVKGEIRKREIYFRTNNEVLIPYPHQNFKRGLVDKLVFRDKQGKIQDHDLGAVIINSLSDNPKFSRGMSSIEYDLWRKNRLDEITSKRNTNGTPTNPSPWKSVKASSKTHFALEGFNFYNKTHVNFSIPKSVLKDLHKKGLLQASPYTSDINIPIHGMPKESRTIFGLEVEFIIYGEDGRKLIAPYIQKGIK